MKLSLNVLNHLGLRLYSNVPTVLSEVVANSYDADATQVNIILDSSSESIVIIDNGHGMTLEDINNKFLYVGYSRREQGYGITPKFHRPVMGRKGIGKLSLFSIANQIEVFTKCKNESTGRTENNGLSMNRYDIETEINITEKYNPKEIDFIDFEYETGTKIVITDFKRSTQQSSSWLRKRLARRFSIIGSEYSFEVSVNGEVITINDRDFYKKIQFIWLIGNVPLLLGDDHNFLKREQINGKIDGTDYEISGWIGSVEYPSDLKQDGVNNNKISIISRGKMAQEDVLDTYIEGGIYASYLIGEITADFLDVDNNDDIATSNRQSINEDDPRYIELKNRVYAILKKIQGDWTRYRQENNLKNAIKKAKLIHPMLEKWYESLGSEPRKQYARQLFSTIESFHFDNDPKVARLNKKELYVQGIVAFEKLRLRNSLSELSKIRTADDLQLTKIFSDLTDLEANLYYDIAHERVEIIKEFQKQLDANDKEKLLQKYLFDNLWILNPSWERPTAGSQIMEQRVEGEFKTIVEALTEEERNGRMDIKYRTATGKHIIIELKRYDPSYKITPVNLYIQVNKYINGLTKCLTATEGLSPQIECIVILGQTFNDKETAECIRLLSPINSRIIYYDQLIEQSLISYSDYLEQQKSISKLRNIIDEIIKD